MATEMKISNLKIVARLASWQSNNKYAHVVVRASQNFEFGSNII